MMVVKEVLTHSSLQQKEWHAMEGHTGKHQGKSGGRQSEGEAWARASMWFTEKARPDGVSRDLALGQLRQGVVAQRKTL